MRSDWNIFKKRKLSDETIKAFGLGYSNKYSDDLYRYLKSKGYKDDMIAKAGLISIDEKNGVYDKFWNRVMFPIMDVNSRVIGFGGRVMGDAKPKYLNSPETMIFDKMPESVWPEPGKAYQKCHISFCVRAIWT